jgi:uroporphyrin-III C-methyltransferase
MGLERLAAICGRLIAGGRDPATPAAAIAAGTCPQQRTITAPLGGLAAAVAAAQLVAPALVIVGDVVRFHELLAPAALVGPHVMAAPLAGDSLVAAVPAAFGTGARVAESEGGCDG